MFLECKKDLRILGGKVLDGHDALSGDALVVGADRQFLSNVAALSKVNAVHVVQIALQWQAGSCNKVVDSFWHTIHDPPHMVLFQCSLSVTLRKRHYIASVNKSKYVRTLCPLPWSIKSPSDLKNKSNKLTGLSLGDDDTVSHMVDGSVVVHANGSIHLSQALHDGFIAWWDRLVLIARSGWLIVQNRVNVKGLCDANHLDLGSEHKAGNVLVKLGQGSGVALDQVGGVTTFLCFVGRVDEHVVHDSTLC